MAVLDNVANWIQNLLSPEYFRYWLIFLFAMAFVESSIFPTQLLFLMPPDVPLIIFAISKPESALLFGLVTTVASVIGGSFGYFLGRRGGRLVLKKFFPDEKIAAVDKLYAKYGVAAVGIAGFTPLPYIAFTWSAGAFKLDFRPFILISLLSRGTRFFAEAVFCKLWGEEFKAFFKQYFNWATIGIAAAVVLLALLVRYVIKRRSKASRET
ncbi:DedA family protein [bacterium]|nr:DedA family protein [bacterium]